jgi:hypothetical protein
VASAWAAFADETGDTGVTSLNRASVEEVANRMGWSVAPLYRSFTLTDEEREAVSRAYDMLYERAGQLQATGNIAASTPFVQSAKALQRLWARTK